MYAKAQVIRFQYSICRSFLRSVRYDRAAGGNEFRKFGGKGVAIVPVFLLLEGRGDDKAMSIFHNLKLLLKRHNDAMMGNAICLDEIFKEISGLPLAI